MSAPKPTPPAPPTPETDCYAVIFTSRRAPGNDEEYARVSDSMDELAATMPGFLGIDTARNEEGVGVTISYWKTEEDIANWKARAEHEWAQQRGRDAYYQWYNVRIAKVERAYAFARDDA